ncbi:helix-turn-helix domain-containing protein [Listeria welshimeri]|uniref:helix-turn-helix domain-containing protein n=1 Tax=Listeria welshimeri TaxID=1643 RepID=UPI0016296D97|nr:helix-turn-helix domain-containing protein [Listeria welshimeri]EAH3791905.1 helix-turn-helix domain-containing protein [Listeria monocytogenes]MBC1623838.1 helix-turn-helix domain-containing protein [Listeria welshimeri]MBF2456577.1 helix-turn-helix domain-containing protein [Listeria welshimeri]MBF2568370.1 helix-turn-helix domain-containing protein [Listeria welshimeri]
MNETTQRKTILIPYEVIVAASEGDIEAIRLVLDHFTGYIITLSTRVLFDEFGTPHVCVDEDLRHRIEAKLVSKLLLFNAG